MHDGVWTGRLILAGFLPLGSRKHFIIPSEGTECGTAATPDLTACQIHTGRQDHHRPLPCSFSTAYSYSMYTNHSLFSNVFNPAALTHHSRNNVDTKSICHATRFWLGGVGGCLDLDKRSSVSASMAPAGSLYCTDWLMYSDQPESTMPARKRA